jgi:TatD DNase family protein
MSTPSLVDIGGNLTNKAFREDTDLVLERAATAGVRAIVVTGVSAPASRRAWEIADRTGSSGRRDAPEGAPPLPRLFATAGIHPHHASSASPEALAEIAELQGKELVVAAGECGLDYDRNFSPPDAQRRALEAQLEIAASTQKPVFLHEREAHEDFVRILARFRPKLRAAVVHCFTGTRAVLQSYLDLDLHVGFTGWLCDERRGTHLRDLVGLVPRGRIMVETDSPYILPRDMPGKPKSGRNEPAFVAHVARAVARHRGETFEDLARHTTETANAFFGIGNS